MLPVEGAGVQPGVVLGGVQLCPRGSSVGFISWRLRVLRSPGRRICIVNEGSNCMMRLKPVLAGACNRSCHEAILYSINQIFIFSTPPGRGGARGLGRIQQR